MSCVCLFFLGIYLLYEDQSQEVNPTYELAMDYIQFYLGFDNAISVALVIKSQQQIYNVMEKLIQKDKQILDGYKEIENIAAVLSIVYDFNHSDLHSIYQKIIDYNIVTDEDEVYLLNLYNNDFCLVFDGNVIPFCDKKLNQYQFKLKYGEYDSKDNNTQYLKSGIVGIVSKMDAFLIQYFEYEFQIGQMDKDLTKLNQQINSQDFNNVIVQHYLDIIYLNLNFTK